MWAVFHSEPSRTLPFLVVQALVRYPCSFNSWPSFLAEPIWMKRRKMYCTVLASSGLTSSFLLSRSTSYPRMGTPPQYFPRRLAAATLSRIRSAMTSRSYWAKVIRMPRNIRPVGSVVLKCWVTETKLTPFSLKRSIIFMKSSSERDRRSTL